jgi:ribosome biogenesis GTPase
MLIATGDWVEVDFSTAPHYRIENILPRRNALTRASEGSYQKEIIVASNLDNLVITTSWQMPMLKLGLIDRYICLANIYNVDPIICINKIDLCEDRDELKEMTDYYAGLDYPMVFTSTRTGEGIEELRNLLTNKDSVFSGQSGTGKSSLINYLQPGLNLVTNEVSDFNEKGVHTTTQARFIRWIFGGNLVDTPGLKTINLHKSQKNLIPSVFPGFADYTDQCYFRSCTHTHEENCAVLEAVEHDKIPIERYDSYQRILDSL